MMATLKKNFPPSLMTNPIMKRTFRYAGASGAASVYVRDILDIMLASSGSNPVCMINSFKIRNIKIWAIDDTGAQRIALVWSSELGSFRTIECFGNNTFPARIDCGPATGSFAGDWITADSAVVPIGTLVFTVRTNCAYILDLSLDFVLENTGAVSTCTVVTATVGLGFGAYLDSLNQGGTAAGTKLLAWADGNALVYTISSRP